MTTTKLWIVLEVEGEAQSAYDAVNEVLDAGGFQDDINEVAYDSPVKLLSAVVVLNDLNLKEHEQRAIEEALRRTHGNQTRAATLLGISRDQLRYKLTKSRRYGAPTEAQQKTLLDKMSEIMGGPVEWAETSWNRKR